jgi:glycyl-tRNA synthetase beta chain
LAEFFADREAHLFETRGFQDGEIKAVSEHWDVPQLALRRIEAVSKYRESDDFKALGQLFKRVKNITREFDLLPDVSSIEELKARLREPAELALADEMMRRLPAVEAGLLHAQYADVMKELVAFREPVDRFFADVLVMVDDQKLREARLALLGTLKRQILQFADLSAVVQEQKQA